MPRHRLWERLDGATEGAATLLVGPGGSGKTLGVAGWLRETGRAESSTWVRADASLTPARLAAQLDPDRLLVLDDAHDLPIATVRSLDEHLERDPDSLKVLLLSRWDLPFTRLSAELLGQYSVLRGELLRLDEEESAALVAAHVPSHAAEVSRVIAGRTQGWCAAVVMTARAVAASTDPVTVARRYTEEGATVADRVASEVFATLQPRQRHLLLCVASEPVVTPDLAVHLTHDQRAGEALAELEAMGLLVTRLPDVAGAQYAIHPLLAEVVRRRTAAGGVDVLRAAATVQRAVRLDVARGETTDAFRRLVAIGDHTGAADLLGTSGPRLVLRGHGAGIHGWAVSHPSAVDVAPASWFALALERWESDALGAARHWLDRIVADPLPDQPSSRLQVACARLMRSRLQLEPLDEAVANGAAVLADHGQEVPDPLVPLLTYEQAVTLGWLGAHAEAAQLLETAAALGRALDLPALVAAVLSHLALTRFTLGEEAAAAELAAEVLAGADGSTWPSLHARGRAVVVRDLAAMSDLPALGRELPPETGADAPEHAADPTTRFWGRLRRSRLELAAGSLSGAERVLARPIETPDPPDHLRATLEVEHGLHATLAGDHARLVEVRDRLDRLGYAGEAALIAGLDADLRGDRRAAAARFERAAEQSRLAQPPVASIALVASGQLRDELGDRDAARDRVHRALLATEVRRAAAPFVGWTRHGTGVHELLDRQRRARPTPWVEELVDATEHLPGLAVRFGPTTAAPGERVTLPEGAVVPVLSPRERDVLYELARGSTYADIAANLFVSENTVKTHVSSLYGKLSVNRRSAALAAARSMHLL
ncbi:LuxR C-terminal-related transcriptional regulator [Nocardioides sp.]|uniref:LuxR C-terminal-related transcriptional regulator n=1 Tax=Nocardioides sp. TaxID=35761 RepID=UPI003783DF7C